MVELSKNRSKAQSGYNIELLQSDIRYKKQLIELNRAKADLINAQFNLTKVINESLTEDMYDTKEPSLFSDDLTILDIKLPTYDIIEAVALKYSHSIRIADSNIEKYNQEYILSKRQRIPNIMVGGGFAWQAKYEGEGNWWPGAFVGGGFDLPVLYTFRPEIDKAKVILEKTKMDKASYENKLKLTLKQNYNNFKYSQQNMNYYKEILEESDKILKMSTERYRKGENNLINLLMVENGHQDILNEYLTAMDIYYGVYLDMMHNMGHDVLLEEEIFDED